MQADPLLLDFAAREPRELAAVLAGWGPDEVASLLAPLPPELAGSLAARLPSRQSLRLMRELPPEGLAGILAGAAHEHALALVSLLSVADYQPIMAAASSVQAKQLSRLFDLPSRMLSAFASPEFIRVDGDTGCQAFKAELEAEEQAQEAAETLPIYVVDERGAYLGEVMPQALLARLPKRQRLRDIAEPVAPLSERMNVNAALKVEAWRRRPALPVVDTANRLLGVVNHQTLLSHAQAEGRRSSDLTQSILDVAMRLIDLYEYCVRLLVRGRA